MTAADVVPLRLDRHLAPDALATARRARRPRGLRAAPAPAFLGGTVGNLDPGQRVHFLRTLAGPDDALLLGTDLVKDPERLVRAYDDPSGVTTAFNRNVLHVLRHRLGADVDPDAFDHVAVWNPEQEWIEMRLRARRVLTVRVLDLEVDFADGEELRTEISAKFTRDRVSSELTAAGLELIRWETETEGNYALSLSRPAAPAAA